MKWTVEDAVILHELASDLNRTLDTLVGVLRATVKEVEEAHMGAMARFEGQPQLLFFDQIVDKQETGVRIVLLTSSVGTLTMKANQLIGWIMGEITYPFSHFKGPVRFAARIDQFSGRKLTFVGKYQNLTTLQDIAWALVSDIARPVIEEEDILSQYSWTDTATRTEANA